MSLAQLRKTYLQEHKVQKTEAHRKQIKMREKGRGKTSVPFNSQEEIYMYFGPKMARTSLSMIQKSNYHYSILYVKILKNWIHTNSN
jgi:hypothetical protein